VCCSATRHIQTPQTLTRAHLPLSPGLCKVGAALLSWGSPLTPSPAEQEQLRRLWKKPVNTPIRCFIGGRALSSILSCLRTPFFSPNQDYDDDCRQVREKLAESCSSVLAGALARSVHLLSFDVVQSI
jgi:hypothetical protein